MGGLAMTGQLFIYLANLEKREKIPYHEGLLQKAQWIRRYLTEVGRLFPVYHASFTLHNHLLDHFIDGQHFIYAGTPLVAGPHAIAAPVATRKLSTFHVFKSP